MSIFNKQEAHLSSESLNAVGIAPALKEWAVVCKALETGRQTILLRKGGIMEYRQGFEVKHNEFFLYPTFEHQSREYLQQDFLSELDMVLTDRPMNNKNKITTVAKAVEVREINDGSILRHLKKFHIWNEHYINLRLSYNPTKPISLIILRVYRLGQPLHIKVRPEFAGCKSWIPIHLSTSESKSLLDRGRNQHTLVALGSLMDHLQPVFGDSEFSNIVTNIRQVFN